jgi:GDP-L-fucose synthase
MNLTDKIYVAGHKGLVGSAIVNELTRLGYTNIITRSHDELDLTIQSATDEFFDSEKPDYVFLAAAKVGGIKANNECPADFARINLQIETNVITAAYRSNVTKLLFLGSSCIYPKMANQPIKESELLSSYLEPTNEGYAIAKIAGLKLCEYYNRQYGTNFISCMPTNLYGPNDNFNLESSHVLPALIRKFLESKDDVICWGDGSALREFLYVDDLAKACVFLMKNYNSSDTINVGTGEDISIKELTNLIAELTNFSGNITWDTSKPNGTPRKVLDVSKINSLGWKAETQLRDGVANTIEWYLNNQDTVKK